MHESYKYFTLRFILTARSSSQATLDSLDMTRYSEDGGGVDERVAVLEFELRKAKENINSLRANLTVVTGHKNILFINVILNNRNKKKTFY
jgi:hypothetical protein